MAHWIIDDQGFGGCYYRCSDCGANFNDICHDVSSIGPCPSCGAPIDTDENEYIETTRAPNKMKRYILFTLEELEDLINGYEIEHPMSGGEVLCFMNKEHFAKMADVRPEEE